MKLLDCDVPRWMPKLFVFFGMYGAEDRFDQSFIARFPADCFSGTAYDQLCMWVPSYQRLGNAGKHNLPGYINDSGGLGYSCRVIGYRLIVTSVPISTKFRADIEAITRGPSDLDFETMESRGFRPVKLDRELMGQIASYVHPQ